MTEQVGYGIVPVFTLADRLRKAREVTGLDQAAFAREMGVSRQTVSSYERGSVAARLIVLKAWALRSGVPLPWLQTGESPRQDGPGGGDGLLRLDSNQRPSGYMSLLVAA